MMDLQERLRLISQVGEEIVTHDELKTLLAEKKHPIAYDGFEPSGRVHIAQGILRAINVNKMTLAGSRFKMLVADWHGWANNKMGGNLENIQLVGKYLIEVWRSCGMDLENVEFVWASELVKDDDYWKKVMQVARNTTVSRIIRCGQIMGREDAEVQQVSQILYPCMQAADIFQLKADICQLGMDQRKVNILAREIGQKLGYWKPVIVSHHMLMGLLPTIKTIGNVDYSKTNEFLNKYSSLISSITFHVKNLKTSNFVSFGENNIRDIIADCEQINRECKRTCESFDVKPNEIQNLLNNEVPKINSKLNELDCFFNNRLLLQQGHPKITIEEANSVIIGELVNISGMAHDLNNEIKNELLFIFKNKMSKSKPDSAIFMTDPVSEVERKIKNAYCPQKEAKDNPVLEYCKYIVFEKFKRLDIKRAEKFGGDITFASYAEVEKAYASGVLHPMDLKAAVASKINELLDPVRHHFEKSAKAKELLAAVNRLEVTR